MHLLPWPMAPAMSWGGKKRSPRKIKKTMLRYNYNFQVGQAVWAPYLTHKRCFSAVITGTTVIDGYKAYQIKYHDQKVRMMQDAC